MFKKLIPFIIITPLFSFFSEIREYAVYCLTRFLTAALATADPLFSNTALATQVKLLLTALLLPLGAFLVLGLSYRKIFKKELPYCAHMMWFLWLAMITILIPNY